jgi:hypothetical protein
MKLSPAANKRRRWNLLRAFTLPEAQISLTIFVVLLGGMAVTYLFGIRLFDMIRPKLDATDQARVLIGTLSQEIKAAARVKIGSGDLTSFTEVGVNTAQSGTAVQIYPSADTNLFVRYYYDSGDRTVKRLVNSNTFVKTMASSVTNSTIFRAEDYAGNVLTNNQNNRVISMLLQFYQKEYPSGTNSSRNASDFFQLRTRVTRRSLL